MNVRDVLPRDAIPSIDDPEFGREYFGDPGDEVLVLDCDPPRAYPLRILGHHEVVNDRLPSPVGVPSTGGRTRAVAVTWCPICWSSVVYDRNLGDRTLELGVSGKLADDALVMYDRETGSEFKQSSGECIAGELSGRRLSVLPAAVTTYAEFVEEFPGGEVLRPVYGDDASPRDEYGMDRYRRYFEAEGFGLQAMRGEGPPREWDREDLSPKAVVLGVERGGEAVGYPAPRVRAAGGVVADSVGGLDVVVVADGESIHAFEDPGFEFTFEDGRLRGDGTAWDRATGHGDDGRRLERVPARRLFAFVWQDDHGPDSFYGD